MSPEQLALTIDDIVNKDTSALHPRLVQEKLLFKQAILLQQQELHRIPSTFQIHQAWERWKRERHLQANADSKIDTTTLYKGQK